MKRQTWFVGLILLVSASLISTASTISSTTAGGNWPDASTWVGGVVPGPNDDVVINGPVAANTLTVRSITINAGATLTGMGGPQWVKVTSSIINRGSVVLNADKWGLFFECEGAIENHGVWRPSSLTFTRGAAYRIGGSAPFEGGGIYKSDSTVILKVTSELYIHTLIEMRAPDYKWTEIDLQGHTLYLDGRTKEYRAGCLSSAGVRNAGTIHMANGGYLDGVWIHTDVTFAGHALMANDVNVIGTVTIADTLTTMDGPRWVKFHGNVVNNGSILPNPNNWLFSLAVGGNLINNGVWNPTTTTLTGTGTQTISQAPGTWFDGDELSMADTLRTVVAGSDLAFHCWVATRDGGYRWGALDMRGHRLKLDGSRGSPYAGSLDKWVITNISHLEMHQNAYMTNVHLFGDVRIYGRVVVGPSSHLTGSIVVVDTLQSAGGPQWFKVYGTFRNEGIVMQHPDRWLFHIMMWGDLAEAGTTIGAEYNMLTEGATRRVSGTMTSLLYHNYNTSEDVRGGELQADGELRLATDFEVYEASTFRIPSHSVVRTNKPLRVRYRGTFLIEGTLVEERSVQNAAIDLGMLTLSGRLPASSGVDSLIVSCRSHQVPASFAQAVQRWWTFSALPADAHGVLTSLRFTLHNAPMNGNDLSTLQVFHSDDGGATWRQLTTDVSIRRNVEGGWVEFDNAPAYGDYVLSSRPDPTSVLPGVIVNILGSDAVRIGAPNRLTIMATNVSPTPIPDHVLSVNLGRQFRILGAEENLDAGGRRALTKAQVTGGGNDSTAMFVIAPLEPMESASLDLLLTAMPTPSIEKTSGQVQLEPATTILVGSFLIWAGGKVVGKLIESGVDYVGDRAAEGVALNDRERDAYAKALNLTSEQVRIRKVERGWKVTAAREVADEVKDRLGAGGVAITTVNAIGENVATKVAPSLRQRLFYWFYKETGLIKDEPPTTSSAPVARPSGTTVMQGRAVTSRDPNEKNGIVGFGAQGYLSTVVPMTYRIRFENVKDAEAAAYRIVVVDTLDATVFDVSSVRGRRASHVGATFTQSGNVLRWEWQGIDLPPNVTPPEGEGYVEFTVDCRPGLQHGAQIRNRATITFDLNDPIVTNTWTNTLDQRAPQTSALRVEWVGADSIEATFQAADDGSGVALTSIFIGTSESAFAYLGSMPGPNIPVRMARPQGVPGTWRFYALSMDGVGNCEGSPTQIVELTTSVDESAEPVGGFAVAPHPFTSELRLTSTDGRPLGTIHVYDLSGHLLLQSSASEATVLNTASWPQGVYLIRTELGHRTVVCVR